MRNPQPHAPHVLIRDYKTAHKAALAHAKKLNMNVALRATNHFGVKGFVYELADRNSHIRWEIVKPTDPESE